MERLVFGPRKGGVSRAIPGTAGPGSSRVRPVRRALTVSVGAGYTFSSKQAAHAHLLCFPYQAPA